MEICRRIWINEISDIDTNNLGRHWTSDESVLATNTKSFGPNQAQGSRAINLYVEVDENDIDQDATEFSNENYPNEKEVVLKANVELKNVIVWEDGDDLDEIEGNAGERCDEWVNNYQKENYG